MSWFKRKLKVNVNTTEEIYLKQIIHAVLSFFFKYLLETVIMAYEIHR